MGMFSSIGSIAGSYFGGPIGGQVGGMIGGALDGKGAVKGAQGMQGDVRAMSEAQYQRALPWDASGEFGSIKYDRSGKAVSSELSKPWQSQLDRLLGRATTTGEQISKYSADPMVAQQQLYEQQQALFRPQQERDILSLEARLQAQGKGGSTGGAGEMRALREAQYMQDLGRQYGAFDKSMDMGTTMRKWEESDIGQATDIGKLPQDYLQMAKSGGITSDPYAKQKVQAAGNVYGAKSSRLDGIGSALSGMSGMFGSSGGGGGLSLNDPFVQDIGVAAY
jgi:hypothetical protein